MSVVNIKNIATSVTLGLFSFHMYVANNYTLNNELVSAQRGPASTSSSGIKCHEASKSDDGQKNCVYNTKITDVIVDGKKSDLKSVSITFSYIKDNHIKTSTFNKQLLDHKDHDVFAKKFINDKVSEMEGSLSKTVFPKIGKKKPVTKDTVKKEKVKKKSIAKDETKEEKTEEAIDLNKLVASYEALRKDKSCGIDRDLINDVKDDYLIVKKQKRNLRRGSRAKSLSIIEKRKLKRSLEALSSAVTRAEDSKIDFSENENNAELISCHIKLAKANKNLKAGADRYAKHILPLLREDDYNEKSIDGSNTQEELSELASSNPHVKNMMIADSISLEFVNSKNNLVSQIQNVRGRIKTASNSSAKKELTLKLKSLEKNHESFDKRFNEYVKNKYSSEVQAHLDSPALLAYWGPKLKTLTQEKSETLLTFEEYEKQKLQSEVTNNAGDLTNPSKVATTPEATPKAYDLGSILDRIRKGRSGVFTTSLKKELPRRLSRSNAGRNRKAVLKSLYKERSLPDYREILSIQ